MYHRKKFNLILAIIFNVGLLVFFKYYNSFISCFASLVAAPFSGHVAGGLIPDLVIPLGISFFTFRAISYQVDVYRLKIKPHNDFLSFLIYFTFFPLIIAGPIARYHDLQSQLPGRKAGLGFFIEGIEMFAGGLVKKVLIGDTIASIADMVFQSPVSDISTLIAWVGILSFTLQVFFDFSGYTDMALGIGRMLGFRYPQNFNYPYFSKNIHEFWQRWHITLSTWLRDYLFLPLAFSLSRKLRKNQYAAIPADFIIYFISVILTFFICGFWHGAGVKFIIWGLYFAFFLIIEQVGLRRVIRKAWSPFQHLYTLLVVVCSWVIFRSRDLEFAHAFLV
jgi:alginate O-acetyltransferase complex protein AlgI